MNTLDNFIKHRLNFHDRNTRNCISIGIFYIPIEIQGISNIHKFRTKFNSKQNWTGKAGILLSLIINRNKK